MLTTHPIKEIYYICNIKSYALKQNNVELRNANGCYLVTQFSSNPTNRFILSELSFLAKVIEIFCMADDFCKFFDTMMTKYTLPSTTKRKYHRDSTMSKAEIMLILILFHDSGYRCLKHFYQEKVCKYMQHLFPKVVSYNRFVELEKEIAIPLALFIKKVLLGKCSMGWFFGFR